jgi:phosphate transport system permease protein
MTVHVVSEVVPEPRRPWKKPSQNITLGLVLVVIAGLIAFGINLLTGLAGLLGWYVGLALALPVIALVTSLRHDWNHAVDRLATSVISVAFAAVLIPWASIIGTVIVRGSEAIYAGYFTTDMLVTSSDDPLTSGGVLHAIVGTSLVVLIASIIAVPLGIIAAIYIVETKGRLASMVRFLTQAMSGVPSIVSGLFIYATIVIFFGSFSAWAAACSLAILMLPTVARTSEEVLKLVSDDLRSASYALGATQARTTFRVVLPTISSGLVTAAVLGVARVAGETAPLILTASYFVKTSLDLNQPIATLPIYIFSNLGIGTDNSNIRAWGGSLVLLGIVFVLFVFARIVSARLKRK